jgi:hypothetical protein
MSKANRNDPCPCGSGKKYKKCCGVKEVECKKPRLGSVRPLLPDVSGSKSASLKLAQRVFKVLTSSSEVPKQPQKSSEEAALEQPQKSYGSLEELIGIEGAPKVVLPPSS